MNKIIEIVAIGIVASVCGFSGAASAASYPVSGKWGQDAGSGKGAIDCSGKRTIDFAGERRFDSGGGVPDFRAIRVEPRGQNDYRITEEFRTGQVNGRNTIELRRVDADHLAISMRGGSLKLRPCK